MPAGQRGAASVAAVAAVALAVGVTAGVGLRVVAGDDDATPATVDGGPQQVVAYACPGGGAEVAVLHRGDRILVTARDRTGDWFEIRSPADLHDGAWIDAGHVTADAALDGLPEGACPEVTDLAGAPVTTTTLAGETTTTTATTATTVVPGPGSGGTTPPATAGPGATDPPAATTVPGATPTAPAATTPTTAAPDTAGPSVTSTGVDPPDVYERFEGGSCPGPTTGTVRARVTDPSGVASVQASWHVGNDNATRAMNPSGSAYTTTFGPYDWPHIPAAASPVPVTVTITATDGAGNVSTATTTVRLHSFEECFG